MEKSRCAQLKFLDQKIFVHGQCSQRTSLSGALCDVYANQKPISAFVYLEISNQRFGAAADTAYKLPFKHTASNSKSNFLTLSLSCQLQPEFRGKYYYLENKWKLNVSWIVSQFKKIICPHTPCTCILIIRYQLIDLFQCSLLSQRKLLQTQFMK